MGGSEDPLRDKDDQVADLELDYATAEIAGLASGLREVKRGHRVGCCGGDVCHHDTSSPRFKRFFMELLEIFLARVETLFLSDRGTRRVTVAGSAMLL